MAMSQRIAVFGLGSMGAGMARSLIRAGHNVHGFDVQASAVEQLMADGGAPGDISSIAASLDTVVVVVLNAAQTQSVLFGDDGIVPRMKRGACVIACATMAPDFAKELAGRCESHGVHYLDAPISGGSVKAGTGQLSVMAAGTEAAFTAAAPALDGMAEKVFKLGDEPGPGSVMKSINQLLAGVHIAAMGEAMTFGIKQGIAPEQILEVISQSAGNSWMFSNRAPHLIEGDYTPHSAVDIWLKDLGIVLDVAKQEKIPAPLTAAALQQYVAASSIGLGREDDAAVAKVYARNANIKLPGTL
jgi:L-threonate 2-dehydrogenase